MTKYNFAQIQQSTGEVMAVTLAVVVCLGGCGGERKGGSASQPVPATNNPDGSSSKSGKSPNGAAGSSSGGQSNATGNSGLVEDAPAVSMQQMFDGLANGKPVMLWNSLPVSYQKDLNDLAKASIVLIDPQVRSKFFEVLKKMVKADKKALIVPSLRSLPETSKKGSQLAVLLTNYDTITALADTLIKSELSNPAWQQNPDIGTLLSGSGAKIMEHALPLANIAGAGNPAVTLAELRGAKVKMGRPMGTNQTVVITTTKTVVTNIVMQVEGKWLPQNVAVAWKPVISQMKSGSTDGQMNQEAKQIVLRGMDVMAGAMLSIEKAQNAQQMSQAVGDLIRVSKMLGGGEESTAEQLPAGRRNSWNYGAGERNTRIDAFIQQQQAGVQQVFGPPDSQMPSQNPQQVEVYWLYRDMQINDLTKKVRATKVYFGFKNGRVVNVVVAP